MKNLKRALSFALASVMLVGMMVVGASAADFGDADKIQNTEAVNTLVALGVIKGKDTGNFDPEGIVTRAEMAKMICVAMSGGKDPNLAGGGMYPDTKNHWASGYIDYCTNLGIVSGDNMGNFNPDKTVTGTEAAKMILIALGYNAETEKYVNDASWAININVDANSKNLYDSVAVNPADGLTRDYAAQMLFNGVQAEMVKYEMVGIVGGNGISQAVDKGSDYTILKEKFKLDTTIGYMTKVNYDEDKAEYEYIVNAAASFGSAAITVNAAGAVTVKSTSDFSKFYGQGVKVLSKSENNKTTLFGIYAYDSAVLASGVVGDLSVKGADTSVKIDGTSYKLTDAASATPVYAYNNGATGEALSTTAAVSNAYAYDLVDNTGDGKGDMVIVYPIIVAKVTYVGTESITAGNVAYKFEDCSIYDGVAKNDYAIITAAVNTAKGEITIAKAEVVTGDVGAVRNSDEYRVDGTWYTSVAAPIGGSLTIGVGDTVEIPVVNGYIYAAKITEGTAISDVIYVIDTDGNAGDEIALSLGGTKKGVDTLILKADGTKTTVKAMRVDTVAISGTGTTVIPTEAAAGLYTYKLNKDNVYELKEVKVATTDFNTGMSDSQYVLDAANQPGSTTFDANTGSDLYAKDDGKLDGKFIADDAVIYLIDTSTPKYKVVTGKDLKSMASYGSATAYLTKAVSGLTTVQVAFISEADVFSGTDVSTGYGYVTSSGYAEKNADDDWVVKFTAWTNTQEEIELTATDVTASGDASNGEFSKGAFVYFTNTSVTGEVTDVTVIPTDANNGETYVKGYDGDKNINLGGSDYTFKDNDKSVVMFINTADKKGVAGGSIELAQEISSGNYVKNAVMKTSAGEVDVLFIDTANKLAGASYTVAAPTAWNHAGVAGLTAIANNSTATSAKGGDTLEIKTTLTGTVSNTSKGATVTVTVTLADSTTISTTKLLADGVTGAQSFFVTMPYQNVASITFSVVANA